MSASTIRVAVTGLAATYPFGGVFWDYIQYVLGFKRLGHEVLYIEDTGKWCYSPSEGTFVPDGRDNAARLAEHLREVDLNESWFYRDANGNTYGRSWNDVQQFCRDADLFLHVSASCWMRDEYFAARKVAFVDSDPMYTQSSVPGYLDGTADAAERERIDVLRRHDVFFTFAENIHSSQIPLGLFDDWIPTRQPIVMDCFTDAAKPVGSRRRVLTTVGSWEPAEDGPLVNGVQYYGKSVEMLEMLDLPKHSPVPLELAMSGRAPTQLLKDSGWNVIDAYSVSKDPWVYRDYLADSLAEWSVAKHAYVASRSGWFSCRSACYLALGVPVIVQNTGFDVVLPTGRGVLGFRDVDEAAAAIEAVAHDPGAHSEAAREIAGEYFDSNRVLTDLIEQCFSSPKVRGEARDTTSAAPVARRKTGD